MDPGVTGPWAISVVRLDGVSLLQPEKSWRQEVTIKILDENRERGVHHRVVLGVDGQNPNLKSVFQIDDVRPSTRWSILISHKVPGKESVFFCSMLVQYQDVLDKYTPGDQRVDIGVRVPCSQQQFRTARHSGDQKLPGPTLILRFHLPRERPLRTLNPETDWSGLVSDTSSSHLTAYSNSGRGRGRKLRHRGKNRPASGQRTPSPASDLQPDVDNQHLVTNPDHTQIAAPPASSLSIADAGISAPRRSAPRRSAPDFEDWKRKAESFVDAFSPYMELCEAAASPGGDKRAENVLKRLLKEWQINAGLLTALVATDVAVFGFAHDSLLAVHVFSRGAVVFGAITASIGLTVDMWFLLKLGGASGERFLESAKDSVYDSYFFFCLTCRLPTVSMFLSVVALTLFLFSISWTVSPAAVLVMACFCGALFGSQAFLWAVRTIWRLVASRLRMRYDPEVVSGTPPDLLVGIPLMPLPPVAVTENAENIRE